MVEWFSKGGPAMWPILISSIVALAVFLERLFTLRRSKVVPTAFLETVRRLLSQQKISEAQTLCEQDTSPLASILQAGIQNRGKPRNQIKESLEDRGKQESLQLSKFIGALGTVAHIAPLLGLLGTVLGMTNVFQVIMEKGVGNAQSLAGGISEALITTVAGLIVAIPTLVAYRYLTARVKAYVTEIEGHSLSLMDQLERQ